MKILARAAVCVLLAAAVVRADDWPQFRGPDRTGVSREKGLLKAWPKGGPKLAWTFKDAGLGFSTVSVAKGVVYTLGTDMKFTDEYVIALDEKSGKELWRAKIGPIFTFKTNQYGDGPRSAPTIDGNLLYALGGQGILVCVDVSTQKEVWRKDLVADLGGKMMEAAKEHWGFSESPVVDGGLVFCTPGGPKGTVAAFDKTTGKLVWRNTEITHNAPYTTGIIADLHGARQFIQTTYNNTSGKETGHISGFDVKTGKILWTMGLFKGTSYALASTPIVTGNKVYVTTGYGHGCHFFEIDKEQKATELFSKANQKKVKNHHGGVVQIGDHIYGHSDTKMWVCQDLTSGALAWDERLELSCVSGGITAADGMLYLYTDAGEVGLVPASPEGFKLVSSFTIPVKSKIPGERPTSQKSQIWAHPVIANGRLYLRDHEYLFAYEIK